MFTKIALNKRLSRQTVSHIHQYLFDFGQGAHRIFWVDDRPYIEIDSTTDLALIRNQFPTMVQEEIDRNTHNFPW